ncbi:hypothetical protein BKA64DRAFT_180747 [Cadophora sp. MPI-SDFR-AT-0126]|nr:hypothetical protein BKA64DRAFT_180747 [Leotiomycetes sp. MPI-SDFR-AT-0126]
MPPLPPFTPFPSSLRVGTDICSIPRILALLKGNHGYRFVRKVLGPEEREDVDVGRVVKGWVGARAKLGRDSRMAEKDSEQGRVSTEVGANAPGKTTRSGRQTTMSDTLWRMKEERADRNTDLLLQEIESRKAWMTSRGYDYENAPTFMRSKWDLIMRGNLDQQEKKPWVGEEQTILSGKEEWLLEKNAQKLERVRIQNKLSKLGGGGNDPNLTTSEDGGGVDGFWEGMKGGVMDGQGMMDGVWVTSRQSSSEKDDSPEELAGIGDTDSTTSNDLTSPALEPRSTPGVEQNKSGSGQIEPDRSAAEQRISTPATRPTNQTTIESTEPKLKTSTEPSSGSSFEREARRTAEAAQVEEEPPKLEDDSSSAFAGEKTSELAEATDAREQSVEELEDEMRDADAEMMKAARFLAGRFAAKEATMKAHLSRRLTYHSILILKPERKPGETGSLAPVAIVLPESDGGNGELGKGKGKEVRISISHDGDFATAVCLAVDE